MLFEPAGVSSKLIGSLSCNKSRWTLLNTFTNSSGLEVNWGISKMIGDYPAFYKILILKK